MFNKFLSIFKLLLSSASWHLQRLTPDGMETLLDCHSTVIDKWLRVQLLPWAATPLLSYFLTGVIFRGQLVLEEFNWRNFSVIIQSAGTSSSLRQIGAGLIWLVDLFDRRESQSAFTRMFSKFLVDQARAQSFWVNSQMYTNLAKKISEILRDK